jgi:hypothetical protein
MKRFLAFLKAAEFVATIIMILLALFAFYGLYLYFSPRGHP